MYKKNQYINRLKRLSNKKLIEIATILGLEKMGENAKTFVDRKKNLIIIYREDKDLSFKKNKSNFSAIFLKEFTAIDDFGKDLSLKYRKILSELYPKFYDDYNEVVFKQIKSRKKVEDKEKM